MVQPTMRGSSVELPSVLSSLSRDRPDYSDESGQRRDGLDAGEGSELFMLGHFRLVAGGKQLQFGRCSQRLLALLALRPAGIERDLVAGLLWPRVAESYAHACLRSALHRIARSGASLVCVGGRDLRLADDAAVDFYEGQLLATRLVGRHLHEAMDLAVDKLSLLATDLLPGWYEEWVVLEAESWRQLRLHALEALAYALCRRERFGEACSAAAAAIAGDPLRETARAVMIRIHLAEGNRSEAIREFDRYRHLVLRDLGREPTEPLRDLAHRA